MRIRIIDAFTDRPFAGNPAGVCLVSDWPSASWMQQVAAELNLSETAFARPHEGADADWDLRWFTPVNEVDLCGHATLATAHALSRDGGPGTVRFSSRSGILITHSRADGTITLDFPVATLSAASFPAGLAEALGAKPDAVFNTGSLGDVLAVFSDEAAVRGLSPALAALAT